MSAFQNFFFFTIVLSFYQVFSLKNVFELKKKTSLRLLKRGTILGVRRLFTALSEICHVLKEGFLNSRERHFPPLSTNALPLLFLHIMDAKRKLSGTRLKKQKKNNYFFILFSSFLAFTMYCANESTAFENTFAPSVNGLRTVMKTNTLIEENFADDRNYLFRENLISRINAAH